MHRALIAPAIAGPFALLFPAVMLSAAPPLQLPLLVVASVSLGSTIGILVDPPRLACVLAAVALGVGAIVGMVISMEIAAPRTLATAEWWRDAWIVSVVAGFLHGAVGAGTAGGIGLAYRDRRRPVAIRTSAP